MSAIQNPGSSAGRLVQVNLDTRKKPVVVAYLAEWEYLEKSLHRMLCGWGRHFGEWQDKVSLFRAVWESAESVRRIRERLVQFPGTQSNLDLAVSSRLEDFANAVLLAPSLDDAVDGILQIYGEALARAYLTYLERAHTVHDAPTLALLRDNVRAKEDLRQWRQEYRRRHPHTIDLEYRARIEAALAAVGALVAPIPVEGNPAQPVGVRTDFRPPARTAHPEGSRGKPDIMPCLEAEFRYSIEARRLFWCYGYLLEMNLAEDQLLWLYDSPTMPWDFHQDVTRHMWDESRHGDSGYSRLLDFGISIQEIGYPYYDRSLYELADGDGAAGQARVRGDRDLYESVYGIGMVAETGHFTVKHEAYDDFREGGDLESAEMMLFDIIDETTHVQYAHKWLPFLAEQVGEDPNGFKKRGAEDRERLLKQATERADLLRANPPQGEAREAYERLILRMREKLPLLNAETCPPRSYKPM